MKVNNNVLQLVAAQNHVSEREVRCEIELAIQEAMHSSDPAARKFWSQFDGVPTPEEVIARIALDVLETAVRP